jgi:two-component system sensor histidine kinase KdpD
MTMPVVRPDPDELLARVQAEEQQQARGRLKIFLGYAAGVGKTYSMLEAAHQRKGEGVDMVVGYVETHRRAETEAKLADLEVIPRRQVDYRGALVPEMDVDALLARRPQLALVDEFAHTNAPGSRHPKRYQDVGELLAAGIDVYTTLNIQHLESLNDVVAQITGVVMRETVPDRALDEAAEIELIDLPPDELLQRLEEGKVYVPEQAARAIQQFFRKGNLTALREMTMRTAAERVDDQMRAYMQTRAIPGPWPAAERLLVAVSAGALAERLVRAARRLADGLNAEWTAIYVETGDNARLSSGERDRIARTLHLAEELGAQSVTIPGHRAADTVLDYARSHNFTKIIAGKPLRSRWLEMLRGSLVDQLIRGSGHIDIYVISDEPGPAVTSERRGWLPHRPWRRYLWALALVAATTLLGQPLTRLLDPANLVMIYLLAVVVAAVYLGRGPSIMTAVLGVVTFDFFFVPPQLTFAVTDTQYLLTFGGLLVVGLVISSLAVTAREQAESAQSRESQTAELYGLSRDLTTALDLDAIERAVIRHVEQTFGREAVIMMPDPDDAEAPLSLGAASAGFQLDDHELTVADWVYRHGAPAGRGTDTLPAAKLRYLPLKTARGVLGVLGVRGPQSAESQLTLEQQRLVESFASQAALALERTQLAEQARRAQVLEATEKLQTALLNSISHDLRTPLVSITGALSTLEDDDTTLDLATRRGLVENAREEAERLNRLVGNLLDMTRLEAGAMKVRREPADVQDLVGSALAQLGPRLEGHPVTVPMPQDLPLVPLDFVLMVQVLYNLLDNALKYSPAGGPIEVSARVAGGRLELAVADRGAGIPAADLAFVFDKFYRVQHRGTTSGTGLGLSICKGIVEAHTGEIRADNRDGGGTVVTMWLPLATEAVSTA